MTSRTKNDFSKFVLPSVLIVAALACLLVWLNENVRIMPHVFTSTRLGLQAIRWHTESRRPLIV